MDVVKIVMASVLAGAAGLGAAGCGGADNPLRTTVTVTAPPSGDASPPDTSATSWTMPDLRGKDLQAAQDAIQALTDNAVFFTTSTDLTGQGRNQIMDRNWQVCTSNPAPGEAFTADTKVDFGVVRIDSEECP